MATPTGTNRMREPVRRPGIWIALVLITLAGVPFYLPEGTIDPIVLGIPLWILGSVLAAVLLSAVVCWVCLRGWSLVEDAEEAERAEQLKAAQR
ncbi:hypothetical protein [Nocardioides insulae]|uniref:hypothetical protein n=1 Tax=Nocardioides insulae TaxID=394734 RepID=UPI00048A910C|nr:hypothetical protein [Nocardioides insulae]